jgi:hypothetical protein
MIQRGWIQHGWTQCLKGAGESLPTLSSFLSTVKEFLPFEETHCDLLEKIAGVLDFKVMKVMKRKICLFLF